MSGFTAAIGGSNTKKSFPPHYIDLNFLQEKIQECLDNGVDDDEDSIKQLIRYYTVGVKKISVKYMKSCNFYVIEMKTVNDQTGQEYHYKFFVHSYR